MNGFAKNYKARYESGSKIIRDWCDDPLEVYVHMGFKEVIFKLGYLSDHNIAYSEPASDHCYGFGGLCNYRFDVDGKSYDFTHYSNEQAIEAWCKTIDEHNAQDCVLADDEELVTTTWREILAFLQQMVFEI